MEERILYKKIGICGIIIGVIVLIAGIAIVQNGLRVADEAQAVGNDAYRLGNYAGAQECWDNAANIRQAMGNLLVAEIIVFLVICGISIASWIHGEQMPKKACPSCGAALESGWVSCPKCGNKSDAQASK